MIVPRSPGSPGPEPRFGPGRTAVGRRSFLRGAGLAGTAAFLAACGISPRSSGPTTVADRTEIDKKLNWSNWQAYIDVDEDDPDKHPTLDDFEKATGIKVTYTEDVNDNNDYFAKIQPQLANGNAISADTFCVTDWMADKIIRLGYALPLDHANIPNLANLDPQLLKIDYDPGRKYSVTWQSGLTGIATNPKATGGKAIETMDQLLTDPALHGKVTLLTEMRDSIGLVLLDLGYNPEDFTEDQFLKANAKIESAVNSGQVRSFTGNDYTQGLSSGDIAACVAWSGDVVQLQTKDPDLQYVLPEAGAMRWSDNFLIPIRCAHKKGVEELINYYLKPDVSAAVEEYVNYICPVPSAKAVVAADKDPDVAALADNELIFPTEKSLAKLHGFMSLDEDLSTRYGDYFNKLTGA